MKTLTFTLTGSQKYWAHSRLVQTIERRTGWDEARVKKFLSENQFVNFNKQTKDSVKSILDELDQAGFSVDLVEVPGGIRAAIEIPDQNALNEIKAQLKETREETLFSVQTQLQKILEKIERIEARQSGQPIQKALKTNPIYQRLTAPEIETVEPVVRKEAQPVSFKPRAVTSTPVAASFAVEKKSTTEADIGKYWLSKIGIFTLLLGVVFLITYTSQFLGAWGKLAIGALLGALLAVTGNFISQKEKYHKWAMSAIGGGWAMLYFTIFAAYHVPLVKVIDNPFVGFFLMLIVASSFIAQSLKFQSRALAFMAYFLAYFATVITSISFYTLAASYLLGVSAVIVTRKLGWSWLALFCLLAIYGIHWVWVEPSIYNVAAHFSSEDRFWEMIVAPWVGGHWQIYPLIDHAKSYLHLSFLALYWLLFTAMSLFDNKDKKNDSVFTSISLINGLVFVGSFIHHLHTYYPDMKWMFSVGMAGAYLWLSLLENKRKQETLSDIYLVFSVALFCLVIPMYFNGSSITYGWSAACASLIWLGLQHQRKVLRVMGWILAVIVTLRVFMFDYLERAIVWKFAFPIYPFLFISAFVGGTFYLIGRFYDKKTVTQDEKFLCANLGYIVSALYFGVAFLMGGLQEIASGFIVLIATLLMRKGTLKNRPSLRYAACAFIGIITLRFLFIDGTVALSNLFSNPIVLMRYSGVVISIAMLFALGEWMRRCTKRVNLDQGYFHYLSITSAALFVVLTSDDATKSLLSLIWGGAAFGYIIYGFNQRERIYRWIGLSAFVLVLGRLFLYDFGQLQLLQRIISFMGLGAVFVIASFIYNYYSKLLLPDEETK